MRSSDPVIYIVEASVSITGAFICARNIARALAGVSRVVLVLPTNSTIGPEDTVPFAAVHHLPIRPLRRNVGTVLAYFPALVIASARLRWLMWRDRASILIINDFYLMHGSLCRLLGFRGKVLTWVRIAPTAFGTLLSGLWLRTAAAGSDRMIAVSRHIQSLLPQTIHTDLIYDGLDPLPPLPPTEITFDRFVYVGNYIPGKGQDHAIEAFLALAEEFPSLSLHFYGGDMGLPRNRAYRTILQARVQELSLQGRIFLHGFLREPSAALRGALAALNFSSSESFSMTVLEAQGAGVPVIATRSGGPAEIIADGETGLLVPVGDVSAMVFAMRTLAADHQRAGAMGRAARGHVTRDFSPYAFRRALLELTNIPV